MKRWSFIRNTAKLQSGLTSDHVNSLHLLLFFTEDAMTDLCDGKKLSGWGKSPSDNELFGKRYTITGPVLSVKFVESMLENGGEFCSTIRITVAATEGDEKLLKSSLDTNSGRFIF